MKIRKIKKEFKMSLRPLRKNRSYKVAKRLRKLCGIGPFSDTISYSQDIWQGKAFLPLLLTIRIGKKLHKAYFSTNSPLFNQKH
jgi:hypothetical protein